MNEKQIIKGLRNNDAKSFDSVFDLLFTELCYFANKIVHSEEDAKEIVCDAFVVFWNKEKSGFEKLENVRRFLYSITRNACINFYKKSNARERHLDTFLKASATEDDFDYAEMEAEILRKIFAEIEQLPSRCKAVFKLYVEGKHRSEISVLLHMSENTVRNHIARAISHLRSVFSEKELIIAYLLFLELQQVDLHEFLKIHLS